MNHTFKLKCRWTAVFASCLLTMNMYSQSCLPGFTIITLQSEIDSFIINHPDCTQIEGTLQIGDGISTDINNLNGLASIASIGNDLIVLGNSNLSDLNGLESLVYVGGDLNIKDNGLATLEGIENIDSVEHDLIVNNNSNLTSLSSLSQLSYIGNHLLILGQAAFTNLNGLQSIEKISGDFKVFNNNSLLNFEGINNLSFIGGQFSFENNTVLQNFQGLESLDTIMDNFYVQFNHAMTNFSGLESLKFVGHNFTVRYNNNLQNLESLINLSRIVGPAIFINGNEQLPSLLGLDSANMETVESLFLMQGNNLTFCSVKSVCDYIENEGITFIEENQPGCNSDAQILNQCMLTTSEQAINERPVPKIVPNPGNGFFKVTGLQHENCIFNVYDVNGRLQATAEVVNGDLNISFLPGGVYFLVGYLDEYLIAERLIIE